MVDYAGARAVARRRRRAAAAAEVTPFLRRLDWILLLTVSVSVGYGLWLISGITHADLPNDPHNPPKPRHHAEAMALIRLLHCEPDGAIVFREPTSGHVHAYAILSHTWGNDEVAFQDMETATGISKTGWRKIRFCAEQAAADGPQ